MEPVSHYYYSDRLKLQFWDWGQNGLPPLLLVHGGLDHARNWDWVARAIREHFHVYAMDLRGHGNSAWAPGATYSLPEYVLDLATLVDLLHPPVALMGHSLGGILTLLYAGLYPDRVRKVVAIEGLGLPVSHRIHKPAPERMRAWMDSVRKLEQRESRSYPGLEAAIARMQEANPHLSDDVARHLTCTAPTGMPTARSAGSSISTCAACRPMATTSKNCGPSSPKSPARCFLSGARKLDARSRNARSGR